MPQELARWRKATYTDVRYRLHFDIPEERTERVDGWITVRLRLDAPADIVLDFREPASSVHEVSINGIRTFMTYNGKSGMQTDGTRGEPNRADGERISRADGETNSADRETGRTDGETSGANGEISQVTENNGRTAGDAGSTDVQGNRTGKDRQPQPIQNEHIVIPAALTRAGENTVDIVFTAGDQSLNRNDEFLYTLLVPDRARTLFPCFDQPDMKALYTLSLEVPMTWKAVSNTYVDKEENLPAEEGTRKLITFSETEPLSTYLFSFVAGEFFQRDYDDGRSSRLARMARRVHRRTLPFRQIRFHHPARLPVRRDGTHRSHPVQRRPYVPESQPHPRGQTLKDRTDSP